MEDVIDYLLEMKDGSLIDFEVIERAKERVKELEVLIEQEENDLKRARLEDERRAILHLLNKIREFRLSKMVKSALHEALFGERLFDPTDFEAELYSSLVEQFKRYLRIFDGSSSSPHPGMSEGEGGKNREEGVRKW